MVVYGTLRRASLAQGKIKAEIVPFPFVPSSDASCLRQAKSKAADGSARSTWVHGSSHSGKGSRFFFQFSCL